MIGLRQVVNATSTDIVSYNSTRSFPRKHQFRHSWYPSIGIKLYLYSMTIFSVDNCIKQFLISHGLVLFSLNKYKSVLRLYCHSFRLDWFWISPWPIWLYVTHSVQPGVRVDIYTSRLKSLISSSSLLPIMVGTCQGHRSKRLGVRVDTLCRTLPAQIPPSSSARLLWQHWSSHPAPTDCRPANTGDRNNHSQQKQVQSRSTYARTKISVTLNCCLSTDRRLRNTALNLNVMKGGKVWDKW
jgi:hypothetical protein